MAVPPMPIKWTDLISDENMTGNLAVPPPGHKVFSWQRHFEDAAPTELAAEPIRH